MSESQPTDLNVEVVEHPDGGWVVMGETAGERKQFGDIHADKAEAETFAKHMFAGADKWTGAATEVPADSPKPHEKG